MHDSIRLRKLFVLMGLVLLTFENSVNKKKLNTCDRLIISFRAFDGFILFYNFDFSIS